MLPPKIQNWLNQDYCPQRILLSGAGGLVPTALEIASQRQGVAADILSNGGDGDVMVFRDEGRSFKIDYSEAAKRDGQSQWENVRGMIWWISQKPVGKHRILILENLERASREAPQALLKILEEPPEKALFIFTTQNHWQILETILSRMTVVTVPGNAAALDEVAQKQAQDFLSASDLMSRFTIIEGLDQRIKKEKNKQPLWDFTRALIEQGRAQVAWQSELERFFEVYQALKRNQNVRLVLEKLALQIS